MATESITVNRPLLDISRLSIAPGATMPRRSRVDLNGVLIDRVDTTDAVLAIREFLETRETHQIVTVNLDFLSIASRDPRFRDIINAAALAVADGMPLVWVSRLKGEPLPMRLTGVELVHRCCTIAARERRSVYLMGAGPGVAPAAAARLITDYPGLRVAGTFTPPFRPLTTEEDEWLVRDIEDSGADFLFVALGAPRQDLQIYEHRDRIHVPVAIGVGCVLDLYAGSVKRAPELLQRFGLEWGYRLAQEPGRLWRRYLLDDIPMLGRLVLSTTGSAQPRSGPAPRPISITERA